MAFVCQLQCLLDKDTFASMFSVSIFFVCLFVCLNCQSINNPSISYIFILFISGLEFDVTEKSTKFDGSLSSIYITFEIDMLHISPLNLSLCAIFSGISVLPYPYPIKPMFLRYLCYCELLLERYVNISYYQFFCLCCSYDG